jgi:hypothetical protein
LKIRRDLRLHRKLGPFSPQVSSFNPRYLFNSTETKNTTNHGAGMIIERRLVHVTNPAMSNQALGS